LASPFYQQSPFLAHALARFTAMGVQMRQQNLKIILFAWIRGYKGLKLFGGMGASLHANSVW
jgi:hypothetical protein